MIKITRAGKIFIVILLIVGVIAVSYQNESLYSELSIFFAFFILSGNIARRNITKLDIDIDFLNEIYANKETKITITIKNKNFSPLYLLNVEFLDSKELFLYIPRKSKLTKEFLVTFKNRGIFKPKVKVCSTFPFNFVLRCKEFDIDKKIIIFPQLKPCKSLVDSTLRSINSGFSNSIDKSGKEDEIYTIRDYIVGDSLKLISWKATAKTDRLKSKELNTLNSPSVIIDFDSIDIKNLELKLSCIATLVNKLFNSKSEVGFKCKNFFVPSSLKYSSKLKILKFLALYGLKND